MSFEIGNILWTPVDVEEIDENIKPIFSTVTDHEIAKITLGEVGLMGGSFASVDITRVFDMDGGRVVEAHSLRPAFLGDVMPSENRDALWFLAGGHVVNLWRQFGTSCYSDRRLQAAARIFGPLV